MWAEFAEVVDCPQESADSLIVHWNRYVYYGLDSTWVGLQTISSDDVTHEECFADKKFHFVDVKLHAVLFKPLKYGDEVAVMVNPGFRIGVSAAWNEDVIGNTDDLETFEDHVDSALPFFGCRRYPKG